MLESIGRALYWQSLLYVGVVASSAELARREDLKPTSISHVLRLALLSPEMVERCLAGQQPRTLIQLWLKRNRLPNDWQEQRAIIDQFD